MITDIPCPYCKGTDINIEEVVWVSFNQENEGLVEILNYCQTCKSQYPVLTEFKYEVIKSEYREV